jgi:hypothetical protein
MGARFYPHFLMISELRIHRRVFGLFGGWMRKPKLGLGCAGENWSRCRGQKKDPV